MTRKGSLKSPAYQWYPRDILSSARVAVMTLEEEGAYRRALDFCWLHGDLPADPEELARVIGKGCSVAVSTRVASMFILSKRNGTRLVHDRHLVERKKQLANRKKKSEAGKISALRRQELKELREKQNVNTRSTDVPTSGSTKFNSTSSSSSSSSTAVSHERVGSSNSSSQVRESARAQADIGEVLSLPPDAHPAVRVYWERFGVVPTVFQQEQIANQVGDRLQEWGETLDYWLVNGHRRDSVGKMLDRFNGNKFENGGENGARRGDQREVGEARPIPGKYSRISGNRGRDKKAG